MRFAVLSSLACSSTIALAGSTVLLLAGVTVVAAAPVPQVPLPQLAGYFAHAHSIGPKSQQYNQSHILRCESAATCPVEAAAACNASRTSGETLAYPFVCRSFAILHLDGGTEAQLYSTDYNESYYVPNWSMWSLSDGPPHDPGPSPPPHGHTDESGREDYCAAKTMAFDYATKLLTTVDVADTATKLRQVSDALQLETACKKQNLRTPEHEPVSTIERSNAHITQPSERFIVYVDPIGGADHQLGSLERPVRTIEAGLGRLRSLRIGVSNMTKSELILRAGVHYVTDTIELTAADSYIAIRGHEGESAVLSGGAPLTLDWHATGKSGVFSSPVPANITDFATLFVAGRRAVRSRSPDANPETQGLHTPNHTGYFPPAAAHPNGTLKQQCGTPVPAQLCPTVKGPSWQPGSVFTYGHFVGAADQNVGYVPSFEPYWCGKWSGLAAMNYVLETKNREGDSNSSAHRDARRATGPSTPLLPDGPSDAVLHMTRGTSDIWANFQWNITSHDLSAQRLVLGKGGWQFPRGTTNGHWFVDNAGIGALTSPGEWYHDRENHMLYMVTNGSSSPPIDVIVSQRPVVFRQRGSQAHPVRGVSLQDLTVAHAEVTYTLPYETPSGGGEPVTTLVARFCV